MRGLLIVLLLGAVPLCAYLLALIFDESIPGNVAAYTFLATLPVWGVAMVARIGLEVRRLVRRRWGR
jgi:hypothetical protein